MNSLNQFQKDGYEFENIIKNKLLLTNCIILNEKE